MTPAQRDKIAENLNDAIERLDDIVADSEGSDEERNA